MNFDSQNNLSQSNGRDDASREPDDAKASRPEPTSSVQRACSILRVMSDSRNSRLTDIAHAAELDKATTLRLLEVLTRNGLVQRNPVNKQYSLGPEVFVLGAAAAARQDLRPIARPSLIRLADVFEDSTMLSLPRGAESVCVDVQSGSYAIRAQYLEAGSRRPLGVGAGSLALLAWLPDEEITALLPLITQRLSPYPRMNEKVIIRSIEQARKQGFSTVFDVLIDRMGGIGVPILGPDRRPLAALSIAALTDRIRSREQAMAEALYREANLCQAAWRH
jgi:DNA-binding IclR family transcriptional regulator